MINVGQIRNQSFAFLLVDLEQVSCFFEFESEVLDLGVAPINCGLLHINLQLHFSIVFLKLLNLKSVPVHFAHRLLTPYLDFSQLLSFYDHFALYLTDLLFVLRHLRLVFSFACFQFCHLCRALSQLFIQHRVLFRGIGQVRKHSSVF